MMKTKTKNYTSISLILLMFGAFSPMIAMGTSNTLTESSYSGHQRYFDTYNVDIHDNTSIDTTFPTWANPSIGVGEKDLNVWIETLPDNLPKTADAYLVYPLHGLAVPILSPKPEDQLLIQQGKSFDHNPYLEKGVLHYFGRSPNQGVGNMVVAGHSSFDKQLPGQFKTVFQVLPISRPGEKIYLYSKNNAGSYDFFQYDIVRSFETATINTSILKHSDDENLLTTYGCYGIGTNTSRRVNQAKLEFSIPEQSVLSQNPQTHDSANKAIKFENENNKYVSILLKMKHQVLIDQLYFSIIQKLGFNRITILAFKSKLKEKIELLEEHDLIFNDSYEKLVILHMLYETFQSHGY